MNHPRNPGFLNPNRRGLGWFRAGLGCRGPMPGTTHGISRSRPIYQPKSYPKFPPPSPSSACAAGSLSYTQTSAHYECIGQMPWAGLPCLHVLFQSTCMACMSCSRAPAWPACLVPEHLHGLHALFQSTWPACRVPEHQHGLQPCSLFLTGRSGLQPACLLPKGMQGPERASLLQSSSGWRMGLLAWSGLLARSGLHPAFTPSPWVHAWP